MTWRPTGTCTICGRRNLTLVGDAGTIRVHRPHRIQSYRPGQHVPPPGYCPGSSRPPKGTA